MRRVFVLGLDSMPPKILYEDVGRSLFKYISELISESSRYVLRSCHPPITVPAWISMFTGKTPGELGMYGFRHRKPGSFSYYIVNSTYVRYPSIWDEAGRKGLKSIVYAVPPSYPPKPLNGYLVTDFTTPGPEKPYTFPPWLKRELEHVSGTTIFDIVYRSENKEKVMNDLLLMIENHQRQVSYLLTHKTWNLFIYVEIGIDRAHHAFWKYFDTSHPRYEYHPTYSKVIPTVYRTIDRWFEKLHRSLLKDAIIVIASDHGVKAMKGAFTINQWLVKEGYLKLKESAERLKPGTDLSENIIDWDHTIAWAWGGYYSRVFINLKGRERRGIVEPKYYEEVLNDLKKAILSIKGPEGEVWRNEVYSPHELYPEVRGDAPDLMVYLDNLSWRPAGTLGWPSNYLPENDRGPDDAVHDWLGVFSIYDPEGTISKGFKGTINIWQVKNILLDLLTE